ncbi:DUF2924 domain-containing protein [Stenotrophobium rhamnosiphilum]|uniref:DUF2924 domain-containing protein n=1 Tax=Stenotrophobium rhamnosiphilum TaxID=2029166 RepID=A0A2T5MBK9_9GAMM|nr:DUF2924 domain-containing protein [Stenotrophobium rhamnosiphilum]PTU29130.1 DUF2924 domain-containing protein [Stenotrophobium rhamnosiphilum]
MGINVAEFKRDPEKLNAKLNSLIHMSRADLVNEFSRAYGRSPPLRLSNFILALATAYRMQEQVYGGLKPDIRKMLLNGKAVAPLRKASPGTLLIREWRGQQHNVTVHEDRVEYQGKAYRSLTEVTFQITGQKRSGPLFFGLKSKAQ